jgi:hypothetical protein
VSEAGDQVVPLFGRATGDDSPVHREPGVKRYCAHRNFLVDDKSRKVTCRKCEEEIDPFTALARLADGVDRYRQARDAAKREARLVEARLEELKREEKNTKARVRKAKARERELEVGIRTLDAEYRDAKSVAATAEGVFV